MSNKAKSKNKKQRNDDNLENESLDVKLNENISEVEARVNEILGKNAAANRAAAGGNVGSIIVQVLGAIKPLLIGAVVEACERENDRYEEVCTRVKFLETENTILREHVEKLEQYSRRDQVKVYGVKHAANEDTDDLMVEIGKAVGSEFSKSDISVSHRVPARNGKLPAIVCKFTTRRVREDFADKTRFNLKDSEEKLQPSDTELKNVFVTDNLTPERAKLLRKLKQDTR